MVYGLWFMVVMHSDIIKCDFRNGIFIKKLIILNVAAGFSLRWGTATPCPYSVMYVKINYNCN
jgi:hypothetical protein